MDFGDELEELKKLAVSKTEEDHEAVGDIESAKKIISQQKCEIANLRDENRFLKEEIESVSREKVQEFAALKETIEDLEGQLKVTQEKYVSLLSQVQSKDKDGLQRVAEDNGNDDISDKRRFSVLSNQEPLYKSVVPLDVINTSRHPYEQDCIKFCDNIQSELDKKSNEELDVRNISLEVKLKKVGNRPFQIVSNKNDIQKHVVPLYEESVIAVQLEVNKVVEGKEGLPNRRVITAMILSGKDLDVIIDCAKLHSYVLQAVSPLFTAWKIVKIFSKDLRQNLMDLQENFGIYVINIFCCSIFSEMFEVHDFVQLITSKYPYLPKYKTWPYTTLTEGEIRNWLSSLGVNRLTYVYSNLEKKFNETANWKRVRLVCAKYSFMCLFRIGVLFTMVSSAQMKLMTLLNELKMSTEFKSMRVFRRKRETNKLFNRIVLTLSVTKEELKLKKFSGNMQKSIINLVDECLNSVAYRDYWKKPVQGACPWIEVLALNAEDDTNMDTVNDTENNNGLVEDGDLNVQKHIETFVRDRNSGSSDDEDERVYAERDEVLENIEKAVISAPSVITANHINVLNKEIASVIRNKELHDNDNLLREAIRDDMENTIRRKFPEAELFLFGSSVNLFGSRGSDVDMCVDIKANVRRKTASDIIASIGGMIKKRRECTKVSLILGARVPIVKFEYKPYGLQCDISVSNSLALENTKLLQTYASIDERVRELVFAVKHFATACDINEPSAGTLSSYAYTLLVIYFLQQRKPPVLPYLQDLANRVGREKVTINGCDCTFFDNLANLGTHFVKENQESAAELLLGFFDFYSKNFQPAVQVVCIRKPGVLLKADKKWNRFRFAIEDPFELDHCLGKTLSRVGFASVMGNLKMARVHFAKEPNFPNSAFVKIPKVQRQDEHRFHRNRRKAKASKK
eukprot:Nk52_evm32s352 gene=Nk52_evmTU32s352